MLRFRIGDLLHQDRKLLVVSINLTEAGSIRGVDNVRGESSSQRIVDLDSYVINRWLWVFMEVLIHTDGVWELDRW
jgi:hypothetical protein